MSFVSFAFVGLYLVALAARALIGRSKQGSAYLATLLVLSLLFYGWHVPSYLVLLLFSTVVDYVIGLRLAAVPMERVGLRRLLLTLSMVTNLGLLAVFKYTGLLLDWGNRLTAAVGMPAGITVPEIVLPIGISFYTFQSMSYSIDIYRGQLAPIRSFWRFLLFVSFFPQLVAGPIVRASEFLYQLPRRRGLRMHTFFEGVYLMLRGFFLKMVCADNLGPIVDTYWAQAAEPGASRWLTLLVAVFFSAQIFCDFAGYSSIARGLALQLGFRLPWNFNAPYIARTFSEFWNRWHITLSHWLRDYLYVPLGGNRRGRVRTYVNLAIVMLLGGLWHGAATHFIVWGGLHGGLLALERLLSINVKSKTWGVWRTLAWAAVVQVFVVVAWVFFRAEYVGQGVHVLKNAVLGVGTAPPVEVLKTMIFLLPPIVLHARVWLHERMAVALPGRIEKGLLAGLYLYAVITMHGKSDGFIYFQF